MEELPELNFGPRQQERKEVKQKERKIRQECNGERGEGWRAADGKIEKEVKVGHQSYICTLRENTSIGIQ